MTSKKARFFLLGTIISVFMVGGYYIVVNKKDKKLIQVDFLKDGIDIKIDNAYLQEDHNNKKEWELVTASATVNKSGDVTYLTDMQVKIYQDDKSDTINIRAQKGEVSDNNKIMELFGDIVLENESYQLNTQKLKWLSLEKKIFIDDYVTIKGDKFSISGEDMVILTDTKTLKINKKVKAVFELG